MKRILAALLATFFVSSSALADMIPVAPPEKVGLSAEALGRVTAALNAEVEKGRIPGAVVAVARRGQLAYFEAVGYRDAATKAPMPKDAIFSIASMTKPFVSVAIMILHDEGKLLLTDPVGKFLPPLAKMQVGVVKTDAAGKETVELVPAVRQMTIQDLLRHTSGIGQGSLGTTAVHKLWPASSFLAAVDFTATELIEKLAATPLLFQPGTAWHYGLSTEVLGLVVEAIAGKPLGVFLEERIFRPLGMDDTSFSLADAKKGRYALAFPNDPVTKKPQNILHAADKPIKLDCGGACAVGSAMDYLRFSQMLLDGGSLNGKRLLSRKTVELMAADHLTDEVRARVITPLVPSGYGFGLGFLIRARMGVSPLTGSVGEYSWGGAYGTYFLIDPKEQLVIIYMSAGPGPVFPQTRSLVKNLVTQSIID